MGFSSRFGQSLSIVNLSTTSCLI